MDKKEIFNDQNLKRVMQQMDRHKKGFIDKEDIRVLLKEKTIKEEVLESMMNEGDINQDGKVSSTKKSLDLFQRFEKTNAE